MKYKVFIKKAKLIQTCLTNFKCQVSTLTVLPSLTQVQIAQVKSINETASSKHSDFDILLNNLLDSDPITEDINDEEVNKFQETILDLFININSICDSLITTHKNNFDQSQASHNTSINSSVRLPRLNLGTFSGQLDKWIAFYNLFKNTVHDNTGISDIEKLSYLLSCLQNEPLNLIKALPVTSDNYKIAWEQIVKRYNNSRLLISLHVNGILDLPQMHKCSVTQLRSFISIFQENVNALKALNYDICEESLFLTIYILRKFDYDFRSKFEHSRSDSQKVPSIIELIDFIEKECNQLEATNFTMPTLNAVQIGQRKTYSQHKELTNSNKFLNTNTVLLSANNKTNLKCTYCDNEDHPLYRCDQFLAMNEKDRLHFVQKNYLCNNCLGNHNIRNCTSKRSCYVCHKRHHTVLHIKTQFQNDAKVSNYKDKSSNLVPKGLKILQPTTNYSVMPEKASVSSSEKTIDNNSSVMVGISNNNAKTVLLATTLVHITSNGHSTVARAVLDSAAQDSFITESCALNLCVPRCASNSQILGISMSPVRTKGQCHLNIGSLSGHMLAENYPVLIIDKISNDLPRYQVSSNVRERMQHFVLADPTFDQPSTIDMIIGAELFGQALKGDSVNLGENMPIALNTVFGFVLIGNSPIVFKKPENNSYVSLLTTTDSDLHNAIQRFWTTENPPHIESLSPADRECEMHFTNTHSRDKNGKYIVHLPFRQETSTLGDSSKHAMKMFKSLEHRLSRNPDLKEKYVDFMNDYQNSGHMVPCTVQSVPDSPHYFLPHHSVLRDEKIRVVFNASAVTSSGVSLNSIMHQGQKLHNEIPDIILSFRQYPIVFACDIQQMFRNIWVHEDDCQFQLIYWRDNPAMPIRIFELKTVTYGMSSSPFIANRVIKQLVQDEAINYPLAAAALQDHIYVDDALLGSNNIENALALQQNVIQLMEKGGFSLRKWLSNDSRILDAVKEEHRATPLHFDSPDQPLCSILGLKWFPQSDSFSYLVTIPQNQSTKRTVLSVIAHLYDPMGWITPVIFWAKSFMQLLWTKGLQWDETLPPELLQKWSDFVQELPIIEKLLIARHMNTEFSSSIQLHGFCDASESGYCASVYLRVEHENQEINVYLLLAKSRVAPLKRVTLPRLELCGAHLLSKLLQYCFTQISRYLTIDQIFGWCDSTIVISWIHTPAYRLKTYVANRVSEIQELSFSINWSYITSLENPADCGSRGINPSSLITHPLWWKGPLWLSIPQLQWPQPPVVTTHLNTLPDIKPDSTTSLHVSEDTCDLFARFSSWNKLIHVTSYVLRFIQCCKNRISLKKKDKYVTTKSIEELNMALPITLNELDQATIRILRLVQQETFSKDITAIRKSQGISTSMQRLSPFIDDNGLIRVGGRLSNSALHYDAKHQVIMPKHHLITNLIIDYYHVRYLHCGPQQLQSLICQKYWIMSARSVIKSRIFRCIHCYKCKPKFYPPKMADLPKDRVMPTRPFVKSAVDFAGPFNVKLHNLRRVQRIKIYICLFICMSTKAVHMEVAMDLTSECFIACLTRFMSRRGLVSHIYSDNATNFTGADRKIRETVKKLVKQHPLQHYFMDQGITFHFIPPRAPHFGGLWERAIQSAKKHMKRVIGDHTLTLEEFITLICRVEAMLNSRPLTPLSNDPGDFEVLTPGHFLTGGPLVTIPELNHNDVPVNRLKRWHLVQLFAQHIWKRWHKEYLYMLQNRPKWIKLQRNLNIGDLVLIKEDNIPPLKWQVGRIKKVIHGRDNIIRVADVNTSLGLLTRPVIKLSPLPID